MRKLIALGLFLLFTVRISAQVSVSVVVQPPYSQYTEDYLLRSNQVLITVTNATRIPQTIKLLGSLEGTNGVRAAVRTTYLPLYPVVIQAGQTRTLNYASLRAAFANLTADDIISEGFSSDAVAQRGRLPEGTYTLCIQAYDYGTSRLVGASTGCATFNLAEYEAPIITQPADEAEVNLLKPQYLMFSWTPAGMSATTRYRLQLVDMTASGKSNPNDAFQSSFLYFDKQNLTTPVYAYSPTDPVLKPNHQYAVRVTAYDPQKKLAYKNNGVSAVSVFTAQSGPTFAITPSDANSNAGKVNEPNFGLKDKGTPPPDGKTFEDPAFGPCQSDTKLAKVPTGQQDGFPDGTHVKVGKFVMKNTVFSKKSGTYSGTGTIKVNFLGLKLRCQFTGIQINKNQELSAGKITAQLTNDNLISDQVATVKEAVAEDLPEAGQIFDLISQNARKVSEMKKSFPEQDLPINLDNSNGNVAIVGVIFEPSEAYLKTAVMSEIPQSFSSEALTLGSAGIAIHPNGFGTNGVQVLLKKNVEAEISENLSLLIKGGGDKPSSFTIDCEGLKSVNLYGALAIARSKALPLDANAQVINDANVRVMAEFTLYGEKNVKNFVVAATFSHPFAIPGVKDLVFSCNDKSGVIVDFSAAENNPDFNAVYKGKSKDWTGVFIKGLTVTFPSYMKSRKFDGKTAPLSLGLQHFMIDKLGVNGVIFAESADKKNNPYVIETGDIAGWGFKISTINVTLANSTLKAGTMSGALVPPLGEKTALNYTASVSKDTDNTAKFGFSVTTTGDIEAEMFFAKLKLTAGSNVTLTKAKDGNPFQIMANLNGAISLNLDIDAAKSKLQPNSQAYKEWENSSNTSKFTLPEVSFQELKITSKDLADNIPAFNIKHFGVGQGLQATIGDAFKLKLNKMEFQSQGADQVGLKIGLGVNLLNADANGNGVGGGADFTIWAKYRNVKNVGSLFRFAYERAELSKVTIDANMGVAQVKGALEIFNKDEKFGNGFKGDIAALITGINAGVTLNLQIGRTLPAKGDYSYWYFNGGVKLPTGIPIPGTVAAIYSFTGGAWYNLKVKEADSKNFMANPYEVLEPANTGAGIRGFRAGLGFGMAANRKAFNGDLDFSMKFNQNWSVSELALNGAISIMRNPETPASSGNVYIGGKAKIVIHIPERKMQGNFAINISAYNIVNGKGEISLYFQLPPKVNGQVVENGNVKWHVKVGDITPNMPAEMDPVFNDPKRIAIDIGSTENGVAKLGIKIRGYVMMGNYAMPTQLPPLPNEIALLIGNKNDKLTSFPSSVSDGSGLAFGIGAAVKVEAGVDFKIVKLDVKAIAGFDLLIADLNATCGGKPMGIDGWYAQGQMYAYLSGSFSLFDYEVMGGAIGAVLQFKGINPYWVRGDLVVKLRAFGGKEFVNYHGTFQRGKLCEDMEYEWDPFNNAKLITQIVPSPSAKKVDVKSSISVSTKYSTSGGLFIENPYDNTTEVYTFKRTVKLIDAENNKEVPVKVIDYKDDFKTTTLEPKDDYLLGNHTYKISVVAEVRTNENKTSVLKEDTLVTFTTGSRPNKIQVADLLSSYPAFGQRHFMKKNMDGSSAKGLIETKTDMCFLFSAQKPVVARFVELSTKKVYETSCSCQNEKIRFDIPTELKNEKVYELTLVYKKANNPNNGGGLQLAIPEEMVMDELYFQTSKYNSLTEKLNAFTHKKTVYLPLTAAYAWKGYGYNAATELEKNTFYTPMMLFETGENFDAYEMSYYKVQTEEGYETANGNTVFVWEAAPKNADIWMSEIFKKYVWFNTLPKNDAEFMGKMGGSYYANYPADYPTNGKNDVLFRYQQPSWLQNHASYEQKLRSAGQLTANENLMPHDGVLTQAEINQAKTGGVYNPNQGKKAPNTPTNYVALADWNAYVVNFGITTRFSRVLAEAVQQVQLSRELKLVEQLGWSQMPHKTYTYDIKGQEPGNSSGSVVKTLKTVSFNYNPPMQNNPDFKVK